MLDEDAYPVAWLGSLYQGRWMVEPDIESIKCTMGLEHLRSQSPAGLESEIWTGMLTYNLVRIKMLQSGYEANREIRSMSLSALRKPISCSPRTGCYVRSSASAKRWQFPLSNRAPAPTSVNALIDPSHEKTNAFQRFSSG